MPRISTFGKNALAVAALLFAWILGARLFRPELTDYVLTTLVVNVLVLSVVNYDASGETPAFSRSMTALAWGLGMSAILYGLAIVLVMATIVFSSLMPKG